MINTQRQFLYALLRERIKSENNAIYNHPFFQIDYDYLSNPNLMVNMIHLRNKLQDMINQLEIVTILVEDYREFEELCKLNEEELELINNNQHIIAIKELRDRTGISLKHAKELVDLKRRELGLIP